MRIRALCVGVGVGLVAGVELVAGGALGEVAVAAVLLDPHPTRRKETANRATAPILEACIAGSMALGQAAREDRIESLSSR